MNEGKFDISLQDNRRVSVFGLIEGSFGLNYNPSCEEPRFYVTHIPTGRLVTRFMFMDTALVLLRALSNHDFSGGDFGDEITDPTLLITASVFITACLTNEKETQELIEAAKSGAPN